MSLYGLMRTSVSGMDAQAQRLAAIADNVANVNTTGFKNVSCEFSSLLLTNCPGSYQSGSVMTHVRNHVSNQGSLLNTSSVSDLAISGSGFFVVSDSDGSPFLTRAGSFVPTSDGHLVNAAGFSLMAYPLTSGVPDVTVNGYAGLEPINIDSLSLIASPSTSGLFTANLPSDADIVPTADLPSANLATSSFSAKSSLVTYDSLGHQVLLDVYFSKTAANQWEVTVYDKSGEAAGGGFPYDAGPLVTSTLDFDPADGSLMGSSDSVLDIAIPGGETLNLDIGKMTQLATDYVVIAAEVNGNAPSSASIIDISKDGLVYATYGNGTRVPVYRIPLAHVTSPDLLTPLAGNVFIPSADSGEVEIGFAQSGSLGEIISGALEQSTVDLATELTSMIDAQRSYTANSKVFQTGSELMDVLVNLKR